MKKMEKFFPLIVGLVILLSVAAYGTRAYFSDSADQETGINLTLGDVNVEGEFDSWEYTFDEHNKNINVTGAETARAEKVNKTIDENTSELDKFVDITNARPGDSFSKKFTFKNTGSLNQSLKFTNISDSTNGAIQVNWEKDDAIVDNVITLYPKNGDNLQNSVTLTMKVSVPLNLNEPVNPSTETNKTANDSNETNLNTLVEETVTVTAKQTNAHE